MKLRPIMIVALLLFVSIMISSCGEDAATPTTTTVSSSALPAATIGCGTDGTASCMN